MPPETHDPTPNLPADPTATHLPPAEPHDPTLPLGSRIGLATWATSAPGRDADPSQPLTQPPASGPPFDLRRVLGRGGMGEVWEATQRSLGRLVAVKRAIARDDDRRAARVREFYQEAAVAAGLEHPNIVPVHDLGIDTDGTPLLAMKLVRGRPWDAILREDFETLSPEDLLAKNLPVLVAVGQAVAFAHSRGIVHRDLKPAQVMVGEYGEVLLMDWGLAIQASHPPEDLAPIEGPVEVATPQTATNPAGTVALMAPEQTAPSAAGIGPWTDVYLLGATLYFLLTGTYPHHAPTSIAAFERARHGDIEDPRKRAPDRPMPEELVALCLAALHREPQSRIPGARAFVEALQGYIGGSSRRRESRALAEGAQEALAAGPESYEAFNRLGASIEKALALWPENPAAGPLLDECHARHARRALASGDLVLARTLARRVASAQLREPLVAEADRREAAVRAQARQRRALIGASFALLLVIIVGGAVFAMKLDEQRRLAEENALRADRKAREARESRAQSDGLVRFMITDLSRKLAPLDEDLEALREAAIRAADYYTTQTLHPERLDERERRATVDSLLDVAGVLTRQGEAARALATTTRAAEFAAALAGPEGARLAVGATVSLGQSYRTNGRLDDAMAAYERAIEIGSRVPSSQADMLALPLGRAHLCRADLLITESRTEEGELAATRGIALLQAAFERSPRDRTIALTYTWGLHKLVSTSLARDDSGEALRLLARIREILLSLPASQDRERSVASELATVYSREGTILQGEGRLEEALAANNAARQLQEELVAQFPTNVAFRSDLAVSITRGGTILADMGRTDEAAGELRRGLAIRGELYARDPANKELLVRVRAGQWRIAELLARTGRLAEALPAREQSLASSRRLFEFDPSVTNVMGLGVDLRELAALHLALGNAPEARDTAREALELLEPRVSAANRFVDSRLSALETLATALRLQGESGDVEVANRALEIMGRLPARQWDGEAHFRHSRLLRFVGRLEEAREAAGSAASAGLGTPRFREYLSETGFNPE